MGKTLQPKTTKPLDISYYLDYSDFSEFSLCVEGRNTMDQREKAGSICGATNKDLGCCSVESVVSIDERGQMVLPKEIREKAKICPGDKLVVVSVEKDGKFCCLSLIKAQDFEGMVKDLLSPMMSDIQKNRRSE
jgi:AbrB family looped-hinge helix DNA binding protein